MPFQPFTTSLIGSLPRSPDLLRMKLRFQKGLCGEQDYKTLLQTERKKAVRLQEDADIDIITSGELERDNYVSFVADKLEGVLMMSMGDMLEYIEDKAAFEQILTILDVPAVSIKNAICSGTITPKSALVADDIKELQALTAKPIKATLPGPYLLTRSMWLPALSQKWYKNKEALGEIVTLLLQKEIDLLDSMGVAIVQFDEPVLTEVVFSEGKTRSFMCAALSEKKDPTEELLFAAKLLKNTIDYTKTKNIKSALHVCRGNWSKNEAILLKGSYMPLLPLFESIAPDILALEFSTPRAGELSSLLDGTHISDRSILGLGGINPRSDEVETPQCIIKKAESALKWLKPEQLWLNPDCGFATFANRPVNTEGIIAQKLAALNEAKRFLQKVYG